MIILSGTDKALEKTEPHTEEGVLLQLPKSRWESLLSHHHHSNMRPSPFL